MSERCPEIATVKGRKAGSTLTICDKARGHVLPHRSEERVD